MKIALIALSLTVSANVFAYSITDSTALTSLVPLMTSYSATGVKVRKAQAETILNDAQEFMQSGKASTFLSQKIKELQADNAGMSEDDALEVLIEVAQSVLK